MESPEYTDQAGGWVGCSRVPQLSNATEIASNGLRISALQLRDQKSPYFAAIHGLLVSPGYADEAHYLYVQTDLVNS